MIETLDLNIDDLLTVCRKLPAEERVLHEAFSGSTYNPENTAVATYAGATLGWIFADPVKPVAAGGFFQVRRGVYSTWFYATSAAWAEHGHEMTRAVRERITELLESRLAHRIETVTLADRSRARDWYPKIGLQFESTLPGYGVDGQEAVRYVALRELERV